MNLIIVCPQCDCENILDAERIRHLRDERALSMVYGNTAYFIPTTCGACDLRIGGRFHKDVVAVALESGGKVFQRTGGIKATLVEILDYPMQR